MQPHPEGGWYREVWRSPLTLETARGTRPLASSIVFLLQPGQESAWHRVASDELWMWQGGGEILLQLGGPGAGPSAEPAVVLGVGSQHLVPAGHWQRAEPAGEQASVAGCVVSPGFEFADFELL